jgi:predicted dehydrogenase
METLRGCLIGCGYFGRIQLDGWRRVTGARMVAVCDVDAARAGAGAAEFDLREYGDIETMLDHERPDFVDIATRPAAHLPLVELAAARRIPVLCQKPLANTWAEAVAICETARRAGIRLMVNENWRWQPWYRRMRDLLDRQALGRLVFYWFHCRRRDGWGERPYPNQPYFKEMPRLLVLETLVHFLDTARFLFGEIEEIYCQVERVNPVIAGEDLAVMVLRHQGGLRGVIDGHRFAEPEQENGQAMCEARLEGLDGVLRLRGQGDLWLGSEKLFDPIGIPGYKGDSCRATQQHFVDCLLSGVPFESEGEDYLRRTFRAVEACYQSAAENRPIRMTNGI